MYAETLLDIAMTHSDALIDQARKGDEKAVSRLVALWHKRIYNFCLKYFGDHDLAMEATQRTFISMYRSMATLKEISSFKSWLYRIASNQCHEEERSSKRKLTVTWRSSEDGSHPEEKVIDGNNDPHKKLHQIDLSDILKHALGQLPAEQREVLIMKEYEGLKFREIAEILDISENTAKSRLYYGLTQMKKILDERNFDREAIYYE